MPFEVAQPLAYTAAGKSKQTFELRPGEIVSVKARLHGVGGHPVVRAANGWPGNSGVAVDDRGPLTCRQERPFLIHPHHLAVSLDLMTPFTDDGSRTAFNRKRHHRCLDHETTICR